jgi:hypothetical protein
MQMTLLFTIHASSDIDDIQSVLNNKDLEHVLDWTITNKLCIHPTKSEYVLFGTHQRLSKTEEPSIMLRTREIKRVLSYKYLGVTMDANLNFKEHVNNIVTKTSKIIGALGRIRKDITVAAAAKIYSAVVLPIMEYCDVVWNSIGTTSGNQLDRAQRRAAKIVLLTSDADAEKP